MAHFRDKAVVTIANFKAQFRFPQLFSKFLGNLIRCKDLQIIAIYFQRKYNHVKKTSSMSSRRRDPHRETNDYNSPLNVLFTTMKNHKLFFDINCFISSESHNFSFNSLASQNKSVFT